MPDNVKDPITAILRYAFSVQRTYELEDKEAAVYSAAFAIYGPDDCQRLAKEAAHHLAEASGNFIDAIMDAVKRRVSQGIFGTMDTSWDYS